MRQRGDAWLSAGCMEGVEMRSTVLLSALITVFILSGCSVRENEVTVIGGSDGPTSIFLATGAGKEDAAQSVKKEYKSDFGAYYEMDDGTWMYDGHYYKYRLEISGKMHNAAKESTFIYLSNIEDISFDRAVMASGLSSNMADYFSPEEAVFIGWKENKER